MLVEYARISTHLQIRVNVLCPSNIETPLKLGIIAQQVERVGDDAIEEGQLAGLGSPEGVASVLRFMVSDEAEYLRGAVFTRQSEVRGLSVRVSVTMLRLVGRRDWPVP